MFDSSVMSILVERFSVYDDLFKSNAVSQIMKRDFVFMEGREKVFDCDIRSSLWATAMSMMWMFH